MRIAVVLTFRLGLWLGFGFSVVFVPLENHGCDWFVCFCFLLRFSLLPRDDLLAVARQLRSSLATFLTMVPEADDADDRSENEEYGRADDKP